MREKIKGVAKLAAFVICLGLLIHWIDRTVVIKYMYDHSEPQTLTYEGFYNMKKESVDVLIMGTSQAAAGFNPQEIMKQVFLVEVQKLPDYMERLL